MPGRVDERSESRELPDWFVRVAEDVEEYCRPREGVWVDVGSGSGGLGLALAQRSQSTILLVAPNGRALGAGLEQARKSGLAGRVMAVAAVAENIPLADGSVDLVVSRGSIFFWKDPPRGLREVYRVLRPGARAMIGGGFGTRYPEWAYKEFFRRRYEALEAEGEEARRRWHKPRRMEWLVGHARTAGLSDLLLDPTPPTRWLLFEKEKT